MDTDIALQDPLLALFGILMLGGGLAAMGLYAYRWSTGRETPLWRGMSAPVIPLSWLWAILMIALLLFHYVFAPFLLPMLSLIISSLAIVAIGRAPTVFWNLRWSDRGKYLNVGTQIFFLMIIPLYLVAVGYKYLVAGMGNPLLPQPAVEQLMEARQKGKLALFFVEALVVAPIWEEALFRGFLYPLLKAKTSSWIALTITSVAFAAMHQHLPTFLPLALFGVILTLMYEKYGSLGYPIALHFIFNVVSSISILTFGLEGS